MKHTLASARARLGKRGPGAARLLPAVALACAALNSACDSNVVAAASARRSNVAPPSITLSPASLKLVAGDSAVITARPAGGEAMLFSVDWRVQEGAAGGSISAAPRKPDGSFDATYTAPRGRGGSFHVVAALHEYLSARAVTRVDVAPRQ